MPYRYKARERKGGRKAQIERSRERERVRERDKERKWKANVSPRQPCSVTHSTNKYLAETHFATEVERVSEKERDQESLANKTLLINVSRVPCRTCKLQVSSQVQPVVHAHRNTTARVSVLPRLPCMRLFPSFSRKHAATVPIELPHSDPQGSTLKTEQLSGPQINIAVAAIV